ncbi:hypothetical protein C6B37_02825, partial [Candidatus Phytoplasma phoenicium]
MKFITIKGRHYRLILFLITTGVLLFCFFLIIAAAYKYREEAMERIEKIEKIDIPKKAKELNEKLLKENDKLKKENKDLKSASYELIKDDGTKEYYSSVNHQLLKKIDKDETIWEYHPNNGMLLKKTDKYHTVTEYGSHGK